MENKIIPRSIPLLFKSAIESADRKFRAENNLWQYLRQNPSGFWFYRRHNIHNCIADFVCYELWLVIELSYGNHEKPDLNDREKEMEEFLAKKGFAILRFTDFEIERALEKVTLTIENKIKMITEDFLH